MPYDDPDATDPMTLHGVEVATDDPGAMREMAACFAEEYVRIGFSADSILEMFTSGAFAGPSLALRMLGKNAVSDIIAEQFQIRGPRAARLPIEQLSTGTVRLPVLED